MKIAYYVASWPPGRAANGIVTYTYNLFSALGRLGHEIFIITPDLAPESVSDIRCFDLKKYWKRGIVNRVIGRMDTEEGFFREMSSAIAVALSDAISLHDIDVLEIEESYGWVLPIIERELLPVVVRLHGPWALYGPIMDPNNASPLNRRRTQREGRAIERATHVTANCSHTLRAVSAYYKINIPNSSIVPTPQDPAKGELWNINTCNRDKILFVGRFDSLKGGDVVLQAFFSLADSNKNLTLTFVGPDRGILGEGGNTIHFDEYMKANYPEWFRKRVDFRGQMRHSDVMAIRTDHYATIVAARIDTMGYMLLEPMSLGCPLITTDVGGIPEFLHDRENALLVASEDAKAMACAMQALLDDSSLASRIGKRAWEDCNSLYRSEVVAKESLAVYERAISTFKHQTAV